jgi:hypothetical protein
MGTRYMTIVVAQGEYKVAQYGHYSGDLQGAGVDICKFIRAMDIDDFTRSIMALEKADPEVVTCVGADILPMIASGQVTRIATYLNFVADSLHCEYAYVLNLDLELLEVYRGSNTTPLNEEERFFDWTSLARSYSDEVTYYPVKQIAEVPFEQLKRMTYPDLYFYLGKLEDEIRLEA